jgi:hypothetical protein
VVEWSITPRCRRGGFGLRGFESLPAHHCKSAYPCDMLICILAGRVRRILPICSRAKRLSTNSSTLVLPVCPRVKRLANKQQSRLSGPPCPLFNRRTLSELSESKGDIIIVCSGMSISRRRGQGGITPV